MEFAYLNSINSVVTDVLASTLFEAIHPQLVQDLRSLHRFVTRMRAVLEDLHGLDRDDLSNFSSHHNRQRIPEQLKEAAEITVELEYEVVRSRIQQQQQELVFSSSDNIIINSMHLRIKQILEEYDKIKRRQHLLGLNRWTSDLTLRFSVRECTSVSDCWKLFGRNEEKEKMSNWLLSDMTTNFALFAIVGIGGLGKTTLAQFVFNDEIINNHFDRNIWIWVSKKFNVVRLTRDVLRQIIPPSSDFTQFSLLQLQDALREKLAGKRVLLVMDDVWDMERSLWESFTLPFLDKQIMVRVIVTTRNETVANAMEAQEIHSIGYLSKQESWELFRYYAFEHSTDSELCQLRENIGKRIVQKCCGNPLLLISFGEILSFQFDEKKWENVLKSEVFNRENGSKVLEDMKLSYYDMPDYLKPCFLVCSMFPRGYMFQKFQLIRLWVALGYIKRSDRILMEDIANDYLNEMRRRSFFDRSLGGNMFKMHNSIYDLGHYILEKNFIGMSSKNSICIKVDIFNQGKMSEMKRLYALILDSDVDASLSPNKNLKYLRYLSLPSQVKLHDSFCHMYNLRLLDLSYFQGIRLPNEIGNLIKLIYLILRYSHIQQLPESICELSNLEMLDLHGCEGLKQLPRTVIEFCNLRNIDLAPEFSEMTKLQKIYIVRSNHDLRQLKDPLNHKEMLCIQNISSLWSEDCREAGLKNNHQLETLQLSFENKSYSVQHDDEHGILESLEPHINLREMEISGYGGLYFPTWISNTSFTKLTKIQLLKCSATISLPSMGQLPCLAYLLIQEFPQIKCIGNEFYRGISRANYTAAFPSLKHLQFKNMYQWEEWHGILDGDFPQLQELVVYCCPMLKSFSNIARLQKYLTKLVFHPRGDIFSRDEFNS